MDILELKTFEGKYLSSVGDKIINPVTTWLNPKLIFIDDNRMECEFEVRPEMADPLGILHGSIRAAMLCDILGILANHPGSEVSAITTSLNIDFIGKAFVGEKVQVIAEIVNKGGSLIYMSGTILNEKKQIVAKGSTSLFVLNRE
jgi:acyl-coenzyme A thioesterase 13